ncbi:MAG: hypothetical protein R6X29_06320 [Acidimicrobiia bacterium]
MLEVARFLAAHPPFRGLPTAMVDEIARSVAVEFFPTGTVILRQGGAREAPARRRMHGEPTGLVDPRRAR